MDLAELERQTREAILEWREADLDFEVIEKGGSGRIFVRVRDRRGPRSLILMHYSDDRPDNRRFAAITDFLIRRGIAAPRILQRREDLNLLWVEDLGEVDLHDLREADWATLRRPAYESALDAVFPLHCLTEADAPPDLPELELSFDEDLYQWEQDYFLNQYVARFVSAEAAEALRGEATLRGLGAELAALPRALVHRDFQSTNVMVAAGRSFLIDYQGLRWGRPEYDLASLVYDPYTEFEEAEREDLVRYYFSLMRSSGSTTPESEFRYRLNQCATQRLMQAMGAYGFLSEVKGKREFLQHIPAARERLAAIAGRQGGLPVLRDVLAVSS